MCYLNINDEKCGFPMIHFREVVVLRDVVKKQNFRDLKKERESKNLLLFWTAFLAQVKT